MHDKPCSLAGKTVLIEDDAPGIGGKEYRVEDWWDRIAGKSWEICESPACFAYAERIGFSKDFRKKLIDNDEVLYGKIGNSGHLVHISEIVMFPIKP